MKKVLSLVLVVLMLVTVMVGCASKPTTNPVPEATSTEAAATEAPTATTEAPGKDIIIAGIYKSGDQQWFIGEGAAAAETVKAMGAKDFMYIDVKLDPDLFLQAVDNAITQGVSGIITCIPDQKLSQVAVQKCKDAGIPIIAADDQLMDADGNLIAPFVGIDAYAIGKAVGEWTTTYAKENDMTGEDTGLLLLTADTVSSCVPRTEGELEVWMDVFPDWPTDRIWRADYTGPQDEAFDVSAATFTANPQIKHWVIMTINDEGAAGATRALEQAGIDKDAVVVGIGGYLAKLEFQKEGGSAFKATAFINYVDVGKYSAQNMMDYLLNNKEIPMDFRTPAVMVTADNYVEIMKDQAE